MMLYMFVALDVKRCLYIRPSVCLSGFGIVLKRLNLSKFFHRLIDPASSFAVTSQCRKNLSGSLITDTVNAMVCVKKGYDMWLSCVFNVTSMLSSYR